jgi:hypothetical protein
MSIIICWKMGDRFHGRNSIANASAVSVSGIATVETSFSWAAIFDKVACSLQHLFCSALRQ